MFDVIGDRIQEIFDAQVDDIGVSMWKRNRSPSRTRSSVACDPPEPIEVMGPEVALETREPVVINEDIEAASAAIGQPIVLVGEPLIDGVRAAALRRSEIGVISLQNLDREHAFSDDDVRLLTTLAGSLTVALENARLFEETRQRSAELALMNDVQRGLAENLEIQAAYDFVGDRIQEIFDAQVVDIGILDQATGLLHFPYSIERGVRYPDELFDLRADRSLTRFVIETGETVMIDDRWEERIRSTGRSSSAPARRRSRCCLPLVVGGEATGISRSRTSIVSTRSPRGCPPSEHARREPERRAGERAAVR